VKRIKSLSEVKPLAIMTIDPGGLGGWACGYYDGQLLSCGLARPDRGERPPLLKPDVVIVELPQHQHNDTAKRTNDLFLTSVRAGHLAEATGAKYVLYVNPHNWKGGVPKKTHNDRCLKRLSQDELKMLNNACRSDGTPVSKSEVNNVIDAIALFFVQTGRWMYQ
jgi:hypothetical protein